MAFEACAEAILTEVEKEDASAGAGNNDVTMLMHISADHTNATVVSFPRDMFVPIPSCPMEDGKGSYDAMSRQKINNTLTYGGLACAVSTVAIQILSMSRRYQRTPAKKSSTRMCSS